jgi:hypothetical protein
MSRRNICSFYLAKVLVSGIQPFDEMIHYIVEATEERKDGDEERSDMDLWKGGCINSLRE